MARTKQSHPQRVTSTKQPRKTELKEAAGKSKATEGEEKTTQEKAPRKPPRWHAGTSRLRLLRKLRRRMALEHALPRAQLARIVRSVAPNVRLGSGVVDFLRDVLETTLQRVAGDALSRMDDGRHITLRPKHTLAAVLAFRRNMPGYVPLDAPAIAAAMSLSLQ